MRPVENPVLAEFGLARCCFVLPEKSLRVKVPLTSLLYASACGSVRVPLRTHLPCPRSLDCAERTHSGGSQGR